MKNTLLRLSLSTLFFNFAINISYVNAQTTEDFETETTGATSFTNNGQNFTITNGPGETTYDIESFSGAGWNGSAPDNKFIDNTGGLPTQNDGTSCIITTTDGTDIYINYLYIFISTRGLAQSTTTMTIIGRKDGIDQYTITKSSGFSNVVTFSPNNGFTLIDFSTEGGSDNSNTAVDELVFSFTNNGDYLAIDAINWEVASVCTDPSVPTITHTPATVCNGGTASLNISGTLNDASAWQVYTGSCGGTNIGNTTTGSFAIPGTISSPSTYYVRGEGGCVSPGSCGTVTVTPQALDDASFSYSSASYCVSASDPVPTITGLSGGAFTSTPGLSLNAGSGQIDASASTPGTYTVTYTTTGTCPNSSNVAVTINALDDPSFSYSASAYCVNAPDPTPTVTGLGGGTFSSTPGLSLNASSGNIDVSTSTPGTYTVTYTTSGTCPNSSNSTVTINALDDASFSYSASSFCLNSSDPTPTITGLTGGTFSSSPVGLSINASTGQIDVSASTPNTYNVTYTTSGTCPNSSSVAVTINTLDNASFSYSSSAYCVDASDPTPTIAGLSGGIFSSNPAGLSLNSSSGVIDVSASSTGTYTVTYVTTGTCPNSTNVAVTINALDNASFSYSSSSYCPNEADPAPTVTGVGGGSFTSSPPGLSLNGSTGLIDLSASTQNSYTVTYTTSGTCPNNSNATVTIEDNTAPVANVSSLPNLTDQCEITVLTAPTAIDNCAGTITGTHNATLPISSSTTITWTYNDGNGNTSTQNQNVVINDNTAPVADVGSLPDLTDQCEITALTTPTATDNCIGIVAGTHNATLPISSSTTITWTYDDGNGNTSTQNQNVIISDNTAPVADVGSLPDLTDQCEITALTAPTATDNCIGTVTGTHNATLPITSSTTIIWTYDDGNGNTSTQNQNVIISDNTAPVADVGSLPDLTDQCEITSLTTPTATDNCVGSITGTHNATLPITSSTTITWTYDDGNGNTATQNQNVLINDNTVPVADESSLADVTSECEVTLTAPTATDNCSGAITGTPDVSFPISASGTTTVTWTYDDGNGNTLTQTQDVIITPIDNSVTQINETSLSADANGYNYQWVDCNNNNAPIAGETNQTFEAASNGSYAIIIDNGNCSVTSACFDITTVGLNENEFTQINIYPNPTSNNVYVNSSESINSIEVINIMGQVVFSTKLNQVSKYQVVLPDTKGVYFLNVKSNHKSRTFKIIKK